MSAEWHEQAQRFIDAYEEYQEESERLEDLIRSGNDDAEREAALDWEVEQLGKRVAEEHAKFIGMGPWRHPWEE